MNIDAKHELTGETWLIYFAITTVLVAAFVLWQMAGTIRRRGWRAALGGWSGALGLAMSFCIYGAIGTTGGLLLMHFL